MTLPDIPVALLHRLQSQARKNGQSSASYLEHLLDTDISNFRKDAHFFPDEQILYQLLNMLPIGAICIDETHRIIFANEFIGQMFGYDVDDLIGHSINMMVPEEHEHSHIKHVAHYLDHPMPRIVGEHDNLRGKRKDGTTFYIELGLNYIYTNHGMQAIAFITNADKHKKIEHLLKKNELALKQAQAQAHVGSWSVNLATGETIWSDEFFRICGLEPGSVTPSAEVGFTIIHPDDRPKATAAFEKTQTDGNPYDIEKRIVHPDGTVHWVKSQGEIVIDEDTQEQILLGTFIDITDIKQAEKNRLKLVMEQQRLKILTDFMQNATHEFRSPLAIMRSSLFLLRRYEDPVKRSEKADIIDEQIQSILLLVDSLTLIVRLETMTHQSTNLTRQSPVAIIDSALNRLKARAYQQSISVTYHCSNCSVVMHENDLELAILHVLDNACRFSHPDSTIQITAGCEADETDKVQITIQDEGLGISDTELAHIFETFWRKDTAHTTPGFGLGLPIAKRIIEQHSGDISVKSEVGQGTEVTLSLPIHNSV